MEKDEIEVKNEVTFVVGDSMKDLFVNAWTNPVQDMPTIVQLGTKHNRSSITLPTAYGVRIVYANPMKGYRSDINFKRGDTVLLDKVSVAYKDEEVNNLTAEILNRETRWHETNIDHLQFVYKVNNATPPSNPEGLLVYEPQSAMGLRKLNARLLDSLNESSLISKKFYQKESRNNVLEYYNTTLYFASKNGDIYDVKDLEYDLNIDSLLQDKKYISFLSSVQKFHYKLSFRKPFEALVHLHKKDTLFNQRTKSYMAADYVKSVHGVQKSKIESARKIFNELNVVPELTDFWQVEYEVPTAINLRSNRDGDLLATTDGAVITFEKQISQLKGEVILLDFWASWCIPCINAFPEVDKLENKFENQDFTVVRISIDDNFKKWKNASKMYGLSNDNYLLKDWRSTALHESLGLNTIPRYVLLNKDGEIVTKSAPHPADDQLEVLIDQLLQAN